MLNQKLDLPYYLMLIIDLDSIKKTFSESDDFIFNSIKSGVNMVQIRDTKTEYANKLTLINKIKTKFNNNCTVIVNSDYKLASESNADGIQIKASEWENFNFSNLRSTLLIGKSTHLYDNHEINNTCYKCSAISSGFNNFRYIININTTNCNYGTLVFFFN